MAAVTICSDFGAPQNILPLCPQFIVIHTVKGFSIVNKADIDIFMELKLKDAFSLEEKLWPT